MSHLTRQGRRQLIHEQQPHNASHRQQPLLCMSKASTVRVFQQRLPSLGLRGEAMLAAYLPFVLMLEMAGRLDSPFNYGKHVWGRGAKGSMAQREG